MDKSISILFFIEIVLTLFKSYTKSNNKYKQDQIIQMLDFCLWTTYLASLMSVSTDRCLSFCTFSFGHCVVCSSSIYGF
jgi:hypothetical protein